MYMSQPKEGGKSRGLLYWDPQCGISIQLAECELCIGIGILLWMREPGKRRQGGDTYHEQPHFGPSTRLPKPLAQAVMVPMPPTHPALWIRAPILTPILHPPHICELFFSSSSSPSPSASPSPCWPATRPLSLAGICEGKSCHICSKHRVAAPPHTARLACLELRD
jgi:hypothetical protein